MNKPAEYYDKKIVELEAKLARYRAEKRVAEYNKLPRLFVINEIVQMPRNIWKALLSCKKWKKPNE